MGRSTHNKNTRSRTNIRPLKHFNLTPPEELHSLEALAESVVAPKKIPHADLPIGSTVLKIQEAIVAFCDALNDAATIFEDNQLAIASADNKVLDLLHESELLPKLNAPNGYRFYQELRDVRIKRRIAKQENAVLSPIYDYVCKNAALIKEIGDMAKRSLYVAECVDRDEYIYRIQPNYSADNEGDRVC